MVSRRNIIKIWPVALALLVNGCTHKWEDHNKPDDATSYVDNNLYKKVAANASLSTFAGYLRQTGYADTLALSKNFTVWAPTNDALKSIDAAVTGNAAALKKFVAHHIATLSFRASEVQTKEARVALLDGKYAWFGKGLFDGAGIAEKDVAAANGILHTISDAAVPLGNCWDYIDSLKAAGNNMAVYLKNRQYRTQDLTHAIQTGVDPVTGAPIYQPGTDSVWRNRFVSEVHDVSNENKQYTVFVLANTPFGSEAARLTGFYATGTADSTADLCNWNVVKDLAADTLYTPATLPDSLVSKYGVKLAVNKSAIIASYRTSNGYVYVMNEMKVSLERKLPEFIIQGENYYGRRAGADGSVFTRTVNDTSTGGRFTDVFVYKHQINQYYLYYRAENVYTTTYKVYWRVVNNTGLLTDPYVQRLAIGSFENAAFPYINVAANYYQEVYLGDYQVTNYGNGILGMYLISANITPNNSNHTQNALLLDYIRLVPVR